MTNPKRTFRLYFAKFYGRAHHKLISLENSINGWAGKIFPFDILRSVYQFAKQRQISVHLDGARLFNAHVETGIALSDYASFADTVSVCFSKGLGAPYGSMLMGSQETVQKAKRFRLWLGGGVHQTGIQAAAAYYALTHNLDSLKKDHELAKSFAQMLKGIPGIRLDSAVETNMVQITLQDSQQDSGAFIDRCAQQGLLLFPWVPGTIRAVVHRHITYQHLEQAAHIIENVSQMALKEKKVA